MQKVDKKEFGEFLDFLTAVVVIFAFAIFSAYLLCHYDILCADTTGRIWH